MPWARCLIIAGLLIFAVTLTLEAIQRARRKNNFLREPDRSCQRNKTKSVT